jgi:cyclopropane-fatty-acyl-phospholipid synthase
MLNGTFRSAVENSFASADVRIGGNRPWDIQVRDERFFGRTLKDGPLGFGESYMDAWWDCQDLAGAISRILGARIDHRIRFQWTFLLEYLKTTLINVQRKSRATESVRRHYDLGNDLYQSMLGPRLVYSCANWQNAQDLDAAEEDKLELVCNRLGVKPGMRILDIGCGWGSFAGYAAEKHGAEVLGITLSKEQAELGRRLYAGLPVEIDLRDYRDLEGKFDGVVSLGMFEHVGYKNYRTYMQIVRRCLRDGGRFYLSTIGSNESTHCTNAWTDKYIFPNSMLPSIKQIGAAIEGLFNMEELHNWAEFYDKTLLAWWRNFQNNWSALESKYQERFYRMWKFYLLSSAGAFRSGKLQVWQIVLAP